MKKIIALVISTFVLFTSCKKDETTDTSVSPTTIAEIQKTILEGYWQLDRNIEEGKPVNTDVYYMVKKFNSNKEYDIYYNKEGKYNHAPWYYKLQVLEGKNVLIEYSSESAYNNNTYKDFDVFEVSIVNGELLLQSKADNEKIYYKKYNSIAQTKDRSSQAL